MTTSVTPGTRHRLKVVRLNEVGAWLDGGDEGELLLPAAEVPEGTRRSNQLDVFVYLDSDDRLIATTHTPKVEVGHCAWLQVVAVTAVGAFMDMGLPKDLLLPFAEQTTEVEEGSFYVVYVYLDNTGRLAASRRLRRFLAVTSKLHKEGQKVDLLVVRHTDLGFEVVVDDTHLGLVFDGDAFKPLQPGDRLDGWVKAVREDGRLDIWLQPHGKNAVRSLAEHILAHLEEVGGISSLGDKARPEDIYEVFGVSKKKYKQALGALYKSGKIIIDKGRIRLA